MSGGPGGGGAPGPLRAGETFDAECTITAQEAGAYAELSRVDNGGVLAEAAGPGRRRPCRAGPSWLGSRAR